MKKKVSVIVCYLATNRGFIINTIQAASNRSITMVNFDADPFKSFDAMFKYVLVVLSNHGLEPRYIENDITSTHDISFIEGHNPSFIQRYVFTHSGYRIF